MPRKLLILMMLFLNFHGTVLADDPAPTTQPDDPWETVRSILGTSGKVNDTVLTYTFPRTDLEISTESGTVPSAAGVASIFHFFKCDCGKMSVIGQFCVVDYEVNDVIDALRSANIKVSSVGPMFISAQPPMMLVRFQGDGGSDALSAALKEALGWTGEARMTTRPVQPSN